MNRWVIIGALAAAPLLDAACDSPLPTQPTVTGSTGGSLAVGYSGGSGGGGGAPGLYGSAAAGAANGLCPLLHPNGPVYYPGYPGSPCPPEPAPGESPACDESLLGTQCVYPFAPSQDVQLLYACNSAGQGYPSYWEGPFYSVCQRTGTDCLLGPSIDPLSGPTVQLASACETRTLADCDDDGAQHTAQENLDRTMVLVLSSCGGGGGVTTAALTVYFDGDCPTSFIVDPADLGPCIQQALETQRFSCAAGLICGASGAVGGCAC